MKLENDINFLDALNQTIPQRIVIMGRPGSGKSTFSIKLQSMLNIPLYHLDKHFFEANWVQRNYQDFLNQQQHFVTQPHWIIDGNSSKSLELRYSRADICLYFNFPRYLCYYRTVKRLFHKHPAIDDRAPGCQETVRWSLLEYMWGYEKRMKPILSQLKTNYPNVKLIELRSDKYDFKFSVIGSMLYWIMLISIFLFMIYLRKNVESSTGDFLFVMLTTIAISFDLWSFMTGLCDFMKEIGDFNSSFSILATPHAEVDAPEAIAFPIRQGGIVFKDLSFAYGEGNPVFSQLNLTIKPGEKIGLIGHSGAGKSTLISLLLKNFKPNSGDILIDNQTIHRITSDSLRQQIALIPQDIMLFHRSIGENIGYAKDNATLDEIKQAATFANIHEFIESLPEKYNTLVGERGVKLSGGQRQRIAIARAILKNAPIVILDEATSSLDSITEQEIQQSINLILEESKATVIAIAHRLSTIRHMDRIVVMEGGMIIEEGTFDQLINNEHGYFKKLWDSQVNGMVL